MRIKWVVFLLGFVVIVSGWWLTSRNSLARPSEKVVDVWATWGDEADHLQSILDRFSQSEGIPVRVTTRIRSEDLLEALAGTGQPDVVILSSSDPVGAYAEQGLVEPLDPWIRATGMDLADIYPAALGQCQGLDGTTLCLPWGCDVDALFWNKDLFAAAGLDPERPPQTIEEVAEYANKLTVRDEEGRLRQVGFIPDFSRSHADLYAVLFGGAYYSDTRAELAVSSRPVVDALNWQMQVSKLYSPDELQDFVASFTPYSKSRHALFAGRRLDCRQCHRSQPLREKEMPSAGFHQGQIAMVVDGQWQAGMAALSQAQPQAAYGIAPFPAPAAYPERASTALVRGPVVFLPAGARDKEAAASLLAWMTSPEILAEVAYSHAMLPSSRTSAQDPSFRQIPNLSVFLDLLARPNAKHAVTTPINLELNEALCQAEEELLH